MRSFRLSLTFAIGIILLAASAKPDTPYNVLARFAAAWNRLQSYTCTWTVHEAKGTTVQDRVYHIFFQKPLKTRAEVIAGDGKGSVAVWEGGDRVRGHQGSILSFLKLNLNINNRLAVGLRGATIAQVNMGWLLSHLQSIGAKNFAFSQNGTNSILSAHVHYPPPNDDVVEEVYVFAPSGLPIEGSQFGDNHLLLKHVVYSNYQLNVTLPTTTWQI